MNVFFKIKFNVQSPARMLKKVLPYKKRLPGKRCSITFIRCAVLFTSLLAALQEDIKNDHLSYH